MNYGGEYCNLSIVIRLSIVGQIQNLAGITEWHLLSQRFSISLAA